MPVLAAMLLLGVSSSTASAQVFGTFTWQMQPYCNQITMTLTTMPGGFRLEGADNQCGASRGSAFGTAVFTPTGTVAVNFTIVTAPAGRGVHVSGVVNPGTGNGTWTDSVGNTGDFVLGADSPGLPPRPVPASGIPPTSITATELAAGSVGATQIDPSQVQRRVTGTCPAGNLLTGVNADGTVNCVPISQPATTLECVGTSVTANSIAAGASSFFNNPACPAGYRATTPYCWAAVPGVFSQGSGMNSNEPDFPTFCAWHNTTASPQTVFGGAVCCRVPAR